MRLRISFTAGEVMVNITLKHLLLIIGSLLFVPLSIYVAGGDWRATLGLVGCTFAILCFVATIADIIVKSND